MKNRGFRRTFRVSASIASGLLLFPATAAAGTFGDTFESYAAGTFPAANWQDTGQVSPFGNLPPPNPSCVVGTTADAFGQPTQALHLDGSWVGSASGIYRAVETLPFYSLGMDVRTDVFGGGATDNPSDWPWMLGVSKYYGGEQAGGWGSLMMYGTNMSQDFRGYSIGSPGQEDFPLGLTILPGAWYRVQIDVDAAAGSIRNRVWNLAGGNLLADATVLAGGWTPADGLFDVVTINQGELSGTGSSDVWVDNVSITATPEPAALTALGFGGLFLRRARRRNAH